MGTGEGKVTVGACPHRGGVRPQEAPGPTSTSQERKRPRRVLSHLPEKRASRAAFPERFGDSRGALETRRVGSAGMRRMGKRGDSGDESGAVPKGASV